jgi:integrase
MSVSDSVSDSPQNRRISKVRSAYGDGSIWSVSKSDGTLVWKIEVTISQGTDGRAIKTRRTARTKTEAIAIRRELNARKHNGDLDQQSSILFNSFARDWLEHVKRPQIRATTAADYEYRIKQYLNPYFGKKKLDEIKPATIQRWVANLGQSGLSSNTVNGARRILFGIFRYAVRSGQLRSNPVEATDAHRRPLDEPTQVRMHWTKSEAMEVLRAAKSVPGVDLFLHLAVNLGLRHGEILGLTWNSIDLESRRLTVNQTLSQWRKVSVAGELKYRLLINPPKTAAGRRTLQLSDELLAAIMRHQKAQEAKRERAGKSWRATDLVFATNQGGPISQSNNLRTFRRFIVVNGFRYIRIHDIRHTTAVLALEAGASLEWISQAFGHSGTEITKSVYAPYVQVLNDRFVDALDQYLNEGNSGSPSLSIEA